MSINKVILTRTGFGFGAQTEKVKVDGSTVYGVMLIMINLSNSSDDKSMHELTYLLINSSH